MIRLVAVFIICVLSSSHARATDPITIVCLGDSTTAPRTTVDAVYADRLAELLAAHDGSVKIINAGVGGSHTGRLTDNARHKRRHALDRLDDAVRAHHPDIVAVQFGINDSWVDSDDANGPSRIPVTAYTENLRTIVRSLREDGSRVILMTPNKIGGRHEQWRVKRLARYADATRALAREERIELIDVWDAFNQFERKTGQDRTALMLDGSHPNDEGHALVASLLAEQILKPAASVDPLPIPVFRAEATSVVGVDRSPGCYAQFREGGVVVTNDGTLVVVAQGREHSKWSDRSGQDLVCRSSQDNGDTWSDAILVVEHGGHSVCPNALVYDRETDTIHLLYNVFEWDFCDPDSRKAMNRREYRQFQITSSDNGRHWSAPREITEMIGSDRHVTVFGSGEGIQLRYGEHTGRLVVPGGFQHKWGNRMFYSDDHGETWIVGQIAPRDRVTELNVRLECKIAELSDGTLVLNARHTPERVRAFSSDGGETWSSQQIDPQLHAIPCNGALLCVQDADGEDVLLCSVPTGPKRSHGSVYASFDGGLTWPISKTLVTGAFAYSSLVQLNDGRIALIYEARNHRDLELVRFPLNWLVESGASTGQEDPNQ